MLILKNTKEAIRVSVCHTATVIANGFMHAGTTSDQFLRFVNFINFNVSLVHDLYFRYFTLQG